ncbi:MAG: hypothetical protein JW959_03085 [Pirellulales bacterium]|nr:hypothetical protein [Pirellulales bacterium]
MIARIPDLTDAETNIRGQRATTDGLSALGGRIFNQSFSFKLLSGLTVLLIAASIAPFFSGRDKGAVDALPEFEPFSQKQADSSAAPEQLRVARNPAERPMTLVPAAADQTTAPEIVSMRDQPQRRESSEKPRMSAWPKEGGSVESPSDAGADESTSGTTRPMAVPPSEYRPEVRSDNTSQSPYGGPRENSNHQPADGNRNDSSRPSVY